MKRLAAAALLLLSLCGIAPAAYFQAQTYLPGAAPPSSNLRQENFFGLTGSAWQNPAGYYVPGTGNPAVSTADYWHMDGVQWPRPYDLTASDCGAAGASIAASKGRYVWFVSHDHLDGYPWTDAGGMAIGFSSDPGVPPQRMEIFYESYRLTPFSQTATVTASISDGSGGPGNRLIVTSVTGTITVDNGSSVTGSGVTLSGITTQLSGSDGGTGTYTITGAAQLVASQAMTIGVPNLRNGQGPYFVCNPDDATYPFYVYAQASGSSTGLETAVTRSSDLITWTDAELSHVNYYFRGYAGYQKVVRLGVNNWYSTGFQGFFPQLPSGAFGFGKWASTDGRVFSPNPTTLFNTCLPVNSSGIFGDWPCTQPTAVQFEQAGAPPVVSVGGQDYSISRTNSIVNTVRVGNQWASRVAIDANFNAISAPARVDISGPYAGWYPGPSYLANTNAYGPEDGIIHYYIQTGFPPSNGSLNGTAAARPYLNGGACLQTSDGTYGFVGSIAGTTLHVTSTPSPVPVGGQIMYGPTPAFITAQLPTDPGDVGTYTIDVSQTYASGSITVATCGGLWQQGLDYYTEIVDASAAAAAAPVGVKDSCSSSVASLTWFNSLPQQTYRLYRGSTAGSQTTLVGDFTGTTATDSGVTLNAVNYHKLVYLHNGVEQKNRVVSTYCSSSIYPEVNAHLTRALAAGADPTTCDRAFMDTFYGWLTSNGLKNNLLFATMPEFCVAKSGSVITKIFDMGTTRLPRGGDYTPLTANTAYNATGINSKPAWVNSANTAYGYYGGGRYNNIRRKTQITLFAAYKKPGTAVLTPFVLGEFSTLMSLTHTAGTPGGISCTGFDATHPATATATVAGLATDVHTASCTFDGTNWTAWSDAVTGTPVGGLVIPSPTLSPPDMLTGQIDNNLSINSKIFTLMSGTNFGSHSGAVGYVNSGSAALSSFRGLFVFDKAFTGAEQTSLDALVR